MRHIKYILLILALFISFDSFAGQTYNHFAGNWDNCITVKEEDGSPSNEICGDIKVTNDALTDNGDGTYNLSVGGGGTPSGWTDDGTVVRLTDATDNVGIGTTAPSSKLHVIGSSIILGNTALTSTVRMNSNIDNWNSIVGASSDVTLADWSIGNLDVLDPVNFGFNSSNSMPIAFGIGGVAKMFIDDTGYIGIGTTTPTTPLEISGPSNSYLEFGFIDDFAGTGNAFPTISPMSSTGLDPVLLQYGGMFLQGVTGTSFANPTLYFISDDFTANYQSYIDMDSTNGDIRFYPVSAKTILNGNVEMTSNATIGIGTSKPSIEFEDELIDDFNIMNANVGIGTTEPTAKLSLVDTGSSNAAQAVNIGSNAVVVTNAGNVGIGNSAPTVALQVTGAVTASGNFVTGNATVSSNAITSGGSLSASNFSIPNSTTSGGSISRTGSATSVITSWSSTASNSSTNAAAGARGVTGTAERTDNTATSTTGLIRGVYGLGRYTGTGTQIDAHGVYGDCQKITSASGAITNCYSVYGEAPSASGGGTVTNAWAGYFNGRGYFANNVGIGTTSPDSKVHIIGGICAESSDSGCTATSGQYWTAGGQVNYPLTVYASGSYALTGTYALIDFGVPEATITIDKAGTYLIHSQWEYDGSTGTASDESKIYTKLRRTNNTAADLSNSEATYDIVSSTIDDYGGQIHGHPVVYTTANTTDTVSIYAYCDDFVGTGVACPNVTKASIVAIRLY